MESPDDNALFWDVWLSLYPELGLKTLKRIKHRLESGEYELSNVIPEDILRRQLDVYANNLKDLVSSLDRSVVKSKQNNKKLPKANGSNYIRCHHKKYVKQKSVSKTKKVSRATSPFISSECLENVLIEELFAQNQSSLLPLPAEKPPDTIDKPCIQPPNPVNPSCSNTKDSGSETDPSDNESIEVICSSSSSDSLKKVDSPEGSLETVIVKNKSPSRSQSTIWCEECNSLLIQLKKQALKTWISASKNSSELKECELLTQIEADLHVPNDPFCQSSPTSPSPSSVRSCDQCQLCGTSIHQLKQQTLVMVQQLERTHKQHQQQQQAMKAATAKGVCPSPVLSSRIPTPRVTMASVGAGKAGGIHSGRAGHYRSQRQQVTSPSPRHEKRELATKQPAPYHLHSNQASQSDLPPRKDSPFPQAIASEKLQRDRRHQRHQHQKPQQQPSQQSQHQQQHTWTACHGQRSTGPQMLNNNAVVAGRNTPVKHHQNGAKTRLLVSNHKMELTPQDYINENGQPADPGGIQPPRPSLLPVQYQHHQHQVHHQAGVVTTQDPSPYYQQQHPHHHHQYQPVTNQHQPVANQQQQQYPNNHHQNPTSAYHYTPSQHQHTQPSGAAVLLSPGGSTSSTGSGTAAAVSFFTRAAQKINLSSKKRKKKEPPEPEPPPFPTNFRHVIGYNPPPIPPALLRGAAPGKLQPALPAKVKVILRICPVEGSQSGHYIRLDARKKQITLHDPTSYSGYAAPSQRSRHVAPTRLFELDSVFSQDDAMPELCSSALVEIIQSVVNGADGCLFSYGHARVGKTYTMIGVDEGPQNLGIIPCAISWLFRLIEAQKERTGARFSVRVSAVEVTGKQEMLKDLLAHVATSADQYGVGVGTGGRDKAPGLYLREDPICGTQLENQSELWSPTAEKAAYYLDAAIAARTVPEVEEDARNSHLLFTIHVYQYRVEKGTRSGSTADGVAGGRSRLHVLDLGSCSKSSKDGQSLSLNALGMAILALINGQKHIPHRESKLTQLLRESLGNIGCRTCMIAHVSPALHAYHETLQVVQLAAKIHRTKRRRKLISGTSSDDSSSCDGESVRQYRRMRTGIRMGTLREMSHSDPDYTSSSEQSCDTVIYVGPHGHALSDQELTDNERPPTSIPMMPRMTPKIQPRTVPTFSRSKSQSGDESGSDAASSVVSQGESKIPKFGEHRSLSGRSMVPRLQESKTVPTSISRPKLGPSPLAYQQSYQGGSTCQDPSLYGPAPLPGYYHSRSAEETQQGLQQQQGSSQETSEQWIDGPMMGPCSNVPPTNVAPYQKTVQGHYVDAPVVPLPKTPVNPSALNEQWIDGPKEFLVARNPGTNNNQTTELKEEGKISLLPKSVASPRSATKSGKDHHRIQRAGEKKTELVHTPTVLQTNEHGKADGCKPCEHKAGSNKVPIKPFVKDWVEKHSGMSSAEATEDERSQRSGHSSRSTKNKGSGPSPRKASMDEMLYGKETHTKKETLHSSPKSSTPNRTTSEVREPDERMMAWVKSVQDSTTNTAKEKVATTDSDGLSDIQRSEIFEGLDNVIADIDQEIYEHLNEVNLSPPPTYEICRMTDCIPEESVANTAEEDGGIEFVVKGSNSSIDAGVMQEAETDSDVTNLLMSNRESIYELQLDGELETSRSSIRNSFHSEDDAWSLGSLPKDSQLDNLLDTEDVDNVEVPDCIDNNNVLGHGLHSSAQISTLDSGNCTQLDNSFVTVESSRGIINELDTSTGISTMDSRDDKINKFDSILQDHEELDLIVDASEYNRKNLEDLPSPSGEPQYAVLENTPVRPCSLRRPDGASNPNLSVLCETPKSSTISSPTEEYVYHMGCGVTNVISPPYLSGGCISYGERSVVGQSPEEDTKENPTETSRKTFQKDLKVIKSQVTSKPPVSFKPSVLPKPSHSKDSVKTPEKPAVPLRASSKGSQSSLKKDQGQSSPVHSSDSSQKTSFVRSHSAPAKSVVVAGVKPRDKSFTSCSSPVTSRSSSSAKPSKNSFSSRLPLCNGKRKDAAQSSPTKSSASSSKDSKSSKDSRSSSKDSGKTSKDSSKSISTTKDSKNSVIKDAKSSKTSRSKSPSPNKRDRETGKDSKLPMGVVRYDVYHHSKGGESDSGIESGQIRSDHRFFAMSPSASSKRSKPRISMHSASSGHGSDVSSTFSGHHLPGKPVKEARDVCNSSGYESMLRDSEVTGTSSSHDSTSESGHSDRSSSKIPKKRSILSKRSKSAPAYSNCSTPSTSRHSSPCKKPSSTASQGPPHPKGWVDTRRELWESEEPLEIKVYEIEDVERMARRRKEELELRAVAKRRLKIRELLEQQEKLKNDFQHAKSLLMVEPVTWSYDLHVAEQMDRDDPDFLEALEKETEILQKRVDACKSRIMMVTCFDNTTSTSTIL